MPRSVQPNATCAYDVYCFGKVLLELVTGKLGFSAAAANDSKMNDWMAKTLSYINITKMEQFIQILDPSLFLEEDLLMEVWGMAVIAKGCLNPQPSKRPLMTHVLLALENPMKVVNYEDSLSARTATSDVLPPVGPPRSISPVQIKRETNISKEAKMGRYQTST